MLSLYNFRLDLNSLLIFIDLPLNWFEMIFKLSGLDLNHTIVDGSSNANASFSQQSTLVIEIKSINQSINAIKQNQWYDEWAMQQYRSIYLFKTTRIQYKKLLQLQLY